MIETTDLRRFIARLIPLNALYGTGPMVRDPQTRKYRRKPAHCDDAGLQPQSRPAC